MRVLNVNSSLDIKIGGGTAERTFQMSRFLAKEGMQCKVLTLDIGLDEKRMSALSPSVVIALDCLWKRFYFPKIRWKTIRRLVDESDIVHLMGHWSILNAIVYIAIRLAGKPYVVCPAGALPLFGRSKFLKWIYNFVIGKAIIVNANGWAAVTSGEFSHFEAYGIPSSKVVVIPNGVSEEDFSMPDIKGFLSQYALAGVPVILFMGRLNLIKGPDLLLQAFNLARTRFPEYQLVFAGPDAGMLSELCEFATKEGLTEQVHFLGHLGEEAKSAAYHYAKLLVVPSRQEAMSIVALEAGICGTPVLMTNTCGFDEISDYGGEVVSPNAKAIADGIVRMLSDPVELKRRGDDLKNFVRKEYSWSRTAQSYLQLFQKIQAEY